MNKINFLLLVSCLLLVAAAQNITTESQHLLYPLPVAVAAGKTEATLFEVSP
jgi:hypothetical protein